MPLDTLAVSSDDALAAKVYLERAQTQSWIIPDVPADTPVKAVTKVGVIGAGTMGGGISMNFLNAGIPVTLVETQQAALDRGLATIRKNYERSAARGRFTMDEVERRLALLTPSLAMEDLADRDLIIEAVYEDMGIKKAVFARLDAIAKPDAVLASNTSYLDVDEIASATARPESVIGMHFFSPANVMKLLEVVRGAKSSDTTIATAMAVGKTIGKVGALVGNGPGFVGNRILFPRQGAANRLILEGALPWDVDRVLTAFGFPMGPFAMSDLAGLDIGWNAATSKSESLRDLLCEADRRGQKTGAGFYDYDVERRAIPSPLVETMIADFAKRQGVQRREVADSEILEFCLYPMVNEGARILDEGKAIRASDIDVVWVNGFGWPAARGGPMYWADQQGLGRIVERLEDFASVHGKHLKPSPLLRRLAETGGRFTGDAE